MALVAEAGLPPVDDSPRRRPVRRALKYVVIIGSVCAVATVGVVVGLNRLTGAGPVTERCTAALEGSDWYLSPDQADNAALVAGTSVARGLPARAATIGLATALQESKLINIDYGDRDSVGLFQQRPSQGWGTVDQILDPVYSTNAFYDVLVKVEGYEDMAVTDAAQTVQRSAYPDAYARHEMRSRAWASALTGNSPGTLSCELAPVADADQLAPDAARDVVAGRLGRDLGLAPATGAADPDRTDPASSTVTVDATPLTPDDPERGAWAAGQWAVATARATQAVEVQVADQVWLRDQAAWVRAETRLGPGEVRITADAAE
ncbi:cobalt transporter [Promicromonospora xylanilytica]